MGHRVPRGHDLSSLRLLGSVGEPINPEAWVGTGSTSAVGRCPVVDTWWQTETGAIMISPLPAHGAKPGSATLPLPGIGAEIVNDEGDAGRDPRWRVPRLTQPWPSMLRGIWGDPERYRDSTGRASRAATSR